MWHSLDIDDPRTFLGILPNDEKVETFHLPHEDFVPRDAKEILIYAWLQIGNGVNPQQTWNFKIFVNVDAQHEAAFYLYARTDPNPEPKWNALNSDNVWLPMPPDRIVRVKRLVSDSNVDLPTPPQKIVGYFHSEVRVVAWR